MTKTTEEIKVLSKTFYHLSKMFESLVASCGDLLITTTKTALKISLYDYGYYRADSFNFETMIVKSRDSENDSKLEVSTFVEWNKFMNANDGF